MQLIDFGLKLTSGAREIYLDTDSQLNTNIHIDKVCTQLLELSKKVKAQAYVSDSGLDALCDGTIEVSGQLLDGVRALKIRGPKNKWKSVTSALKSLCGASKIQELGKRLAMYRDAMNLHLHVDFRQQYDLVALRTERHFQVLDAQAIAILDAVIDNRDVFEALRHGVEELRSSQEDTRSTVVVAHNETRRQTAEALLNLGTVSETQHQTTQDKIDTMHRTLELLVSEMEDQKEVIRQLHQRQERTLDLREQQSLQDKLEIAGKCKIYEFISTDSNK
ncbi:MAG: hypothetical protein M1822_006016 [Bathelium mastoideum]|nr:MAG: hypothetical protein M1822_006016 [Bathelium mastoideum]